MKRKKLNIGLFGFGCVGAGLYEVLQKTPALNAVIKNICIRDDKKERTLAADLFTTDPTLILNDPEINVVVELISDPVAAFEIVAAALRKGKMVVTANKKMLADNFTELIGLQNELKVPLLYEGACCASIPIIRNLEEYYHTELLTSIEGIVNGSTNFILSKIKNEKLNFETALFQAQLSGFAESDPSLDVEGHDAKYKLLILIAHAFGAIVKPQSIFNLGINRIKLLEQNYANEKGVKIKLVAHAERDASGKIRAFVLPKFVNDSDLLYAVDGVYNGIKIKSSFSDSHFFLGQGAGSLPTGSAVLSDLSAISYGYKYEYKKLNQEDQLADDCDIILNGFWSFDIISDTSGGIYFNQVEETYFSGDSGYFVGNISVAKLKLLLNAFPNSSFVLIKVVESAVKKQTFDLASVELLQLV